MSNFSKRGQKALEILSEGGYIFVGEGRDYHGRPAVVYELYNHLKKRVSGFGIQTMREIESQLNRKQDRFGFEYGLYRLADK